MIKIGNLRAATLAASLAFAFGAAHAAELTVVNFGGANGDAQKAAFNEPFQTQTGNKVTAVEYNGEQAKVKAMVEAKHVNWDVVEVETGDIARGCDEGLYEKLDWSKLGNKADIIKAAQQPCGAGIFVWSTALAYNGDRLKTAPAGWADFWDVKKFPGKRGMRKGAQYNLEFALMADGVAPQDVYKVLATKAGQDRAFKKLDELKPNIQWWEAGAQPPQFLVAGDVVMSTAYNGRIDAAQREGKNLKVVWNGSIYDLDYWAIPKGTPNKALAEQYIAYTLSPKPQQDYAKHIAYGPVNMSAVKSLDTTTLSNLPNSPANGKNAVQQNLTFWTDHGDELEQRFASWAAK
ncbi:ABC transporter substrate-binding protein [Paraburkholderia caballeronis]|uniref:Putative spermidine/putrescine transport system substrate-binding protein n=1 Tax=Paraburkholderia caballeronis TaxID=416943 RepID=A0A1H7VKI5_9BURK|nr:ABC transporter substrate-binding protein [Paraburkholderia caballeronis]PXW16012.1 putative spermidine/putrescine transport system substrate-binding protein [Paraburkholderia caballeronis]PXW93914.1 putative spermidine/putrescine transport system substrate-binding protein [Paraburkholderia caballeronis]RAJ89043.1 putative spermidine/putrescine transport system substrate-binding protein [Paraburkholderia caballeronis]TDV09307.1 putative spermidine/putrescine transport system substrate-bindin